MSLPRVLLVDDDEINLATLEAVLGTGDYELHSAAGGAEACAAAERLRPDLVLLDVMMPGMDGFAVCRHLRAIPALATIPVVMLTALNDQASRLEGLCAGADDFISKPCPIEELRARVRTITRLNRYRTIAEQRARFEQLFEFSPASILLLDADDTLAAVNARADDLLSPIGAAPRVGAGLETFLPALAVAELRRLAAAARRDLAPPPPVSLRLACPGGERILHVRAAGLLESRGPLVMLVLDDISAEVRAREDLETLNRNLDALVRARTSQLEEANQLLMSYAVFVSHDLRSPLSIVRGYLSFLDTGPVALPPEFKACVGQAHAAAGMMDEMITNILRLAADEHAARRPAQPVDPAPILRCLADKLLPLQPARRARIEIGPLPSVFASAPLLERVFFNLLANALKYTADRAEPRIEVGAFIAPAGPVLFVRDNGPGFDARDAANLFREFSRLPGAESSEGLGLGLSLVSRLLRAHQGRIWAEGRPGEGATFFVSFAPAERDDSSAES